jgi:hypothetical protein
LMACPTGSRHFSCRRQTRWCAGMCIFCIHCKLGTPRRPGRACECKNHLECECCETTLRALQYSFEFIDSNQLDLSTLEQYNVAYRQRTDRPPPQNNGQLFPAKACVVMFTTNWARKSCFTVVVTVCVGAHLDAFEDEATKSAAEP